MEKASQQTVGPAVWDRFLRGDLGVTLIISGLAVVLTQVVSLFTFNRDVLFGRLDDADCYMHLERAWRLMTMGGGMHRLFETRINAPFGYAIHWTVLFDWLIVAGAWPLHWLGMPTREALYVWGSAISPLFFIFGVAALAIGARHWIKGPAVLLLVALVFFQPFLISDFLVGRIDHHSAVSGLLLAQLAWLYAYFDDRTQLRWAALAGVFLGIQLCILVEGLLSLLLVGAALCLAWIVWGKRALKPLSIYLLAAAVVVGVWVIWEEGPNVVSDVAYDRVSLVHLLLLSLGTASIAAISIVAEFDSWQRNVIGRSGLVMLGVLPPALGMLLVFPDFFAGPWPHMSPAVALWHKQISEIAPLIPLTWYRLAYLVINFAGTLVSLPLEIHLLRKGTRGEQGVMLATIVGQIIFGGLAFLHLRSASELQAVSLLPLALTILRVLRCGFGLRIGRSFVPLRAFAVLAILVGPFALANEGIARIAVATSPPGSTATPTCNWDGMISALPASTKDNAILLTDIWEGPEILWRTSLRVVAAPYEGPAIIDSMTFSGGNTAAVLDIVRRRRVNLVLVCGTSGDGEFVTALRKGDAPAWLNAVALPRRLSDFHLYWVIGGQKTES